jgi:hypothetical protein
MLRKALIVGTVDDSSERFDDYRGQQQLDNWER